MLEIKNPLTFNNVEEAESYIKSLNHDELCSFRDLIATKEENMKKLESTIRRFIKMYLLMASHEDLKMNYMKLLDLTNKYGHRIISLLEEESKNNQINKSIIDPISIEELQLATLKELNELYDLKNITNPLCSTLTNKLKTLANVMVNFTNSCNKQVFGKSIDEDTEVTELPICIIGGKSNGKWDYKACLERLKDQLYFNLNN